METLSVSNVHSSTCTGDKSNRPIMLEIARMNDKLNKMYSDINGMKRELNITHNNMSAILFRIEEINNVRC